MCGRMPLVLFSEDGIAQNRSSTNRLLQHRRAKCCNCLYEVKVDCCSRMRYNPINNNIMAVHSMLDAMEGMLYLPGLRRCSVEIVVKVLEVRGAGVACYGGGLRRVLGTVENCPRGDALCAGSVGGDAFVLLCMLEAGLCLRR